uniref:Transporter n=1 Tax=Tetranychus urticae TaxID=32264 RepID=T1K392_TETUR
MDDDDSSEQSVSIEPSQGSFNLRKITTKLFNFSQISNGKCQYYGENECTKVDICSSQERINERGEWDKKIDFLLSIIGFAVDLANVWRFPYLCYKNGGGKSLFAAKRSKRVFLIPYTLMLIFGALPLFFLELSLGQFARSGPISIWDKMYPAAKGVGYCAVLISWYVSFYYNVIIGDLLPWQHCDNEWNTENCFAVNKIINCENCTNLIPSNTLSTAAQEFFERKLLQVDSSKGFNELGNLRPEMVGCVAFTFILLYFALWKGVKSSGKVVWVTATAPYIILTILLIRGVFLPGAGTGIAYYLSPRLEKLQQPGVWVDAAVQVFYSIGVGFGVHLTYASFNKFNNNCYRDALLTACINSCTSFYSGFVIFVYLGYMAQSLQADISTVAKEGYGLVFQVYPEAISTLPLAKLWSILFFVMLVTLGLDSAMGGLEAVITGITDEWKIKKISRERLTAMVLFASFLVSLINCTQGGGYTMVWFDSYAAAVSLLCSALFEALAIVYGYGINRFCLDIESMLGFRPAFFWKICWKYISPFFLICIITLSCLQPEPIIFMDYVFPSQANILGWIFGFSSVIPIPVIGIFHLLKYCLFKQTDIGMNVVRDRKVIGLPFQSAVYI